MRIMLVHLILGISLVVIGRENIPMMFCGLRLGQQVSEGMNPASETEQYYGYRFPAKETILKFNQYQVHASLISKTITNAGAGYTTDSKSDAEELFSETCRWLEKKYLGKKCEDYKLPNRTIKVMRFGEDTDGYYMVEINTPLPGMYLVMITLYNDELSKLEEREAKAFASKKLTGQNAPLQFNTRQAYNNLNQGKPICSAVTGNVLPFVASTTTRVTALDQTKDTMGTIRSAIEAYQMRNKTLTAPKDINSLKPIVGSRVRTWKDGWGNDFVYECDGERWALLSAGADKKYHTEDDLMFICEDGMNVTTVGFPTGNGKYFDSEVAKRNNVLREKANEDTGGCPDGWSRIAISGFVTVDIPPTIELRKGNYKMLQEELAKTLYDLDLRVQALTFQQAGLNDLEEGSMRRYARIIFKSVFDENGHFDWSDEKLSQATLMRIEEEEYAMAKKEIEQLKRSGFGSAKIIKWYPVRKVRLGGLSGYCIAYLHQQETCPPIYVEVYKLGSGRYLHLVTFSYRQSEEMFWKSDYSEIKRRIKFNKMR